jgi:hypothetical protein
MRPALLAAALLLSAVAVLLPGVAEAQCAMCRTALDSPEGRRLIGAFQNGVLFLLAVPLVTFGTVAWLAVRGQRRVAAAQIEAEGTDDSD